MAISFNESAATDVAANSTGTTTGRFVQVDANGNAPAGTQIGDIVVTAGGNYQVVAPNTPGATYNPNSQLWSIKVDSQTTNQSGSTAPYVPQGTYNDQGMSAADLAKIQALKDQWEKANAIGDEAGKQTAHAAAQAIRSQYGYSGGTDGSMYLPIEMPEDTVPKVGLPSYTPQVDQTNAVYDAAKEAAIAALKDAYDQSRLDIEHTIAGIPQTYQNQRNAVAAQSERDRLRFNEYANAYGLNSGTGGQAALAFSTQLQNDLGSLRTAEANAISEAQLQLTKLYTSYQNSIAEAVANNEYERAAALLAEYKAAAQSLVETAQNQAALDLDVAGFNKDTNQNNYNKLLDKAEALAQFGDFSGYLALGLSQDQVNNMRKTWLAANPEIAAYLN